MNDARASFREFCSGITSIDGVTLKGILLITNIIGTIIFGAILGVLARFFMKGEQNIGMLWTIILGVIGSVVGNIVLYMFNYNNASGGIAWLWWIVCIICSMVAISIYMGVRGRK